MILAYRVKIQQLIEKCSIKRRNEQYLLDARLHFERVSVRLLPYTTQDCLIDVFVFLIFSPQRFGRKA